MDYSSQITEIEISQQHARAAVARAEALTRLTQNRDFQEVILKGYFENEAVRLVHALTDPALQSVESQASLMAQMRAIAECSGYLNQVLRAGEMASKALADAEEVLAELRAAELEE